MASDVRSNAGLLVIPVLLLLMWAGIAVTPGQAQPINRQQWEQIRDKVDYTESPVAVRKQFKAPGVKQVPRRTQVILFSAILLVLAGLLVWALFQNAKGARTTPRTPLSPIMLGEDEGISDEELKKRYREALESGDFRHAIRYFYLLLLRRMALQGMLTLRKDTTNRQYLEALSSTDHYAPFKRLTGVVEAAWFGGKTIDRYHLEQVTAPFDHLDGNGAKTEP